MTSVQVYPCDGPSPYPETIPTTTSFCLENPGHSDPRSGAEVTTEKGPQALLVNNYEISTRFCSDLGSESPVSQGKPGVDVVAEKRAETAAARRTARWEVQGVLWRESTLPRVRRCGRQVYAPSGRVGVRQSDGSEGYAGLMSCGSVWACPRCNARIMATRRLELGVAMAVALGQGLHVVFGTITLRHKRGQSLAKLWKALSDGQRGVTNATRVKRLRKQLGRVGYVRATEVTHGSSGWHPHIHTLMFFDKPVSQKELDELRDAEFDVWVRQCKKFGLGKPLKKRYELKKVFDPSNALSDYFTKGVYELDDEGNVPKGRTTSVENVSFELTSSLTKKGRAKNRTHWKILQDAIETGDADDWDLWWEFEAASKGKRSLLWSNGLKKLLRVEERDDQDIVDEEVGSSEDTLFWILNWSRIVQEPSLGGKLLAAVHKNGLKGGLEFCQRHGVSVSTGEPSGSS